MPFECGGGELRLARSGGFSLEVLDQTPGPVTFCTGRATFRGVAVLEPGDFCRPTFIAAPIGLALVAAIAEGAPRRRFACPDRRDSRLARGCIPVRFAKDCRGLETGG